MPDIYGKGIDAARRMLFAQGWQPKRPARKPDGNDLARAMSAKGLIEAGICSGTGVGWCIWNYRQKAAVLHVVTVGGEPMPENNTVLSYDVECGAGV